MLRISTNLASLATQRAMGNTQRTTEQALKALATGNRFANAGTDAAGFAISENMRSQVQGYKAARYNADNAVSFVDVAQNALQEQNNILVRLRELAIQAASDTFSDAERGMMDFEYQALTDEFERIAQTTTFGSQNLLNGSVRSYEFQVGLNAESENIIEYTNETDTTASSLGIDGSGVGDKHDARSALRDIDKALHGVNEARARLGAISSRMEIAVNHIDTQVEGLTNAHSKMADTDIAQAVSDVRRGQILQQYQASALALANESQNYMLRLIA